MTGTQYQRGMADGETRAQAYPEVRTHSLTAPEGSSRDYARGWRVGFANVRNLRVCTGHLAAGDESYRDQVEYMAARIHGALFAWAHGDCAGTFTFHERMPAATVFACGTCGQHRVAQDDPQASDRAMAGLAELLTDAADATDVRRLHHQEGTTS
jgi:hypothetical protein